MKLKQITQRYVRMDKTYEELRSLKKLRDIDIRLGLDRKRDALLSQEIRRAKSKKR